MRREPVETRFWRMVVPEPNTGCFLWLGVLNQDGYGQIRLGRRMHGAHRIAYMLEHGALPEQYVLHSCNNPSCVNARHLRSGDQFENMQDRMKRGWFPNGTTRKQRCKNGHEFTDTTTTLERLGRRCRICYNEWMREYRRKREQNSSN